MYEFIFISLWIIFGFINWCTALGDLSAKFPGDPRSHYGRSLFMAILGPIGAVGLLFTTNIYRHGFRIK